MASRRQNIIDTVTDCAGDFMYYGRKEDEDLPRGEIEAAIKTGEITMDEILEAFRKGCGEHM